MLYCLTRFSLNYLYVNGYSFPFSIKIPVRQSLGIDGGVLEIVFRVIATHLINKAGFTRKTVQTNRAAANRDRWLQASGE